MDQSLKINLEQLIGTVEIKRVLSALTTINCISHAINSEHESAILHGWNNESIINILKWWCASPFYLP